MNRFADAFDFDIPTPVQKERMSRLLDSVAARPNKPHAGPWWVEGADGRYRPPEIENTRHRVMTAPGATSSELRAKVEHGVRAAWHQVESQEDSLSDEVRPFVKELAEVAVPERPLVSRLVVLESPQRGPRGLC